MNMNSRQELHKIIISIKAEDVKDMAINIITLDINNQLKDWARAQFEEEGEFWNKEGTAGVKKSIRRKAIYDGDEVIKNLLLKQKELKDNIKALQKEALTPTNLAIKARKGSIEPSKIIETAVIAKLNKKLNKK